MQLCLEEAGRKVDASVASQAWSDYSESLCASWMTLPESDELLLKVLLEHLPPPALKWQLTVVDAGDGSGDGILPLPEELIKQLGWKVDDRLSLFAGEEGGLVLKRHSDTP